MWRGPAPYMEAVSYRLSRACEVAGAPEMVADGAVIPVEDALRGWLARDRHAPRTHPLALLRTLQLDRLLLGVAVVMVTVYTSELACSPREVELALDPSTGGGGGYGEQGGSGFWTHHDTEGLLDRPHSVRVTRQSIVCPAELGHGPALEMTLLTERRALVVFWKDIREST